MTGTFRLLPLWWMQLRPFGPTNSRQIAELWPAFDRS